ncbi:MAG TPA: LysR family transcriptional regulator [Gemmatimonadaceae bacterium]|jgi:DNA-binding transcriptional LysR family regulator
MTDQLNALRLFVHVARTGSFSRSGRELGLSQSSASRTIKALERELGVTLLRRTTRAVVLTEVGRDYLARVVEILTQLDDAANAARGDGALHGLLRVAMPTSIAIRLVIPLLDAFMAKHPALRIDLAMADRRQDPIQEGIDVAISFGLAKDSPANARHIGTNERMLVASPSYLAKSPVLASPDDLYAHTILTGSVGRQSGAWSLGADGHTITPHVQPRLGFNVNEAAVAAAVQGLGILSTGYWGCQSELTDGRLVRVLPNWKLGTLEMYVVVPAGKSAPRAARAFANYLVTSLQPMLSDARVNERRPSRTASRR